MSKIEECYKLIILLFVSSRFELIGKLETNREDTECIFEILGVSHLFDVELHNMKSKNGRSDDLVASQYATLTKQQIQALYDIYKYDFEAFEYDYQSFLDMAVDGIQRKS